jgi:hypothetical protein
MDDELRQVQEEISATKADLTEAKRERKDDLVLMYGNLLVGLNQKKLLLHSAGEMHYNRCIMRYSVVSDTADFSLIFTVGNLPR